MQISEYRIKLFNENRYLGFSGSIPAHFTSMYSPTKRPSKGTTDARVPPTAGGRREVGFSQTRLCQDSEITMIASNNKTSAQSDDELRQKAFKRIIDICEDSISRDDIHMTIQCEKCAKCKTYKDIRKINASSYNDFMEQLVKFIKGKDGEPGYFISPLPLKPFNVTR